MRLVAGRDLQGRGLDLDEVLASNQRRRAAWMRLRADQERAAGRHGRAASTRGGVADAKGVQRGARRSWLAIPAQDDRLGAAPTVSPRATAGRQRATHLTRKERLVKVIASSLRKGNVVDMDGKLYVVLTGAEHPPRQGHAGHPARHAPHLRRGEGLRALPHHRAGRARLRRGPGAHLPLPGRRGLPLHEPGDLRPGGRAQGRDRRPGGLSAGGHGR